MHKQVAMCVRSRLYRVSLVYTPPENQPPKNISYGEKLGDRCKERRVRMRGVDVGGNVCLVWTDERASLGGGDCDVRVHVIDDGVDKTQYFHQQFEAIDRCTWCARLIIRYNV